MKMSKLADLEALIEQWLEENAEEPFWPHYIPESLAQEMAKSAAAVFDACQDGQEHFSQNHPNE